jgi:hypothetical protein
MGSAAVAGYWAYLDRNAERRLGQRGVRATAKVRVNGKSTPNDRRG